MFNIFKKELISKDLYLISFFFLFFLFVVISVWSKILGSPVAMGVIYEEFILFVGIIFTTIYYQKYKREDFLKVSYLSGIKKNKIKFYLLIYIFIYLFIFSYICVLLTYLLTYLNVISNIGITGHDSLLPTFAQLNFLFLNYCFLMYILLIVGFGYLLNHFFKNVYYIFGLTIVIFLFNLRFSSTTVAPLVPQDGHFIYDTAMNSVKIENKISFYILPWSMIGIRFSELFLSSSFESISSFSQYYDLSYATIYKNFEWLPYVYLILIYGIPLVFNKESLS